MKNFKIEKNISIPHKQTCKKYPFREMEIDDSFLVENYSRGKMNNILSAGRNFAAKSGDCTHYKFATRKEGNNIRIWRVE
jgi:hypothetical protein